LAFFFLFLGMEGAFQFLKLRTGSALGPLLAAPAFGLNGFFSVTWLLGWAYFYGFALLPWVLVGIAWWIRGRAAGLLLTVGCFATMIGFGGTYAVPLTGLFALVEVGRGLYRLNTFDMKKRAFLRLAAAGLLTVAACVFRLWPIMETMHSSPRVMAGAPANTLAHLYELLLTLPSRGGGQFFMGPAVVLLACAACMSKRALFPAVIVVLCGWLAIGYSEPSLFAVLRAVPIFNLLRYPERLLLPGSLYLAELGALGFNLLLLRAERNRAFRVIALACVPLAIASALLQGYETNLEARKVSLVPQIARVEQPFALARGNRLSQGYFAALNRGSIACGEGYPVRMSRALRGDRPAEEFLEDASLGSARRVDWSPNRIEVDVQTSAPTYLIVNQNWHPGWHANQGTVVARDGLLAVKLDAGTKHVVLRFLPRSAIGGALVSALALAIAAWFSMRWRKQEQKPALLLAAALVPLAAWGSVAVAWHEELPEPILTNQDGSPILVAALPADATVVNGRFDLPIRIEGARVTPADSEGFVTADLYWRVTGTLPRSLGIFVHFESPGKTWKVADHEVIAGTYFLKLAPKGVLLHDALAIRLDTRQDAGEWTMRVGLWHASGDGSRVPAFTREGTRIDDDRHEVARFRFDPPPE
jgi:hypothetical protein